MSMTANGLVKLIEECGELQQIAAKKLAYFNTDEHPDGAGSIATRMEDELADVAAAATFVVQQFGLDGERIKRRAALKLDRLQKWHAIDDKPALDAAIAAKEAEK